MYGASRGYDGSVNGLSINLVDEVVDRVFKYSVFAEKLKQRAAN